MLNVSSFYISGEKPGSGSAVEARLTARTPPESAGAGERKSRNIRTRGNFVNAAGPKSMYDVSLAARRGVSYQTRAGAQGRDSYPRRAIDVTHPESRNMNEAEREIQRLTAELEKINELLEIRTAILSMSILSAAWRHTAIDYAGSIRDQVLLLRRNLRAGGDPETNARHIDLIAEMVAKILEPLTDPPLSAKEKLEILCVNDLLRFYAQFIATVKYGEGVSVDLQLESDERVMVQAHKGWIVRVLEIVIKNATRAMSSSPQKTLTVNTSVADDGMVEIVLRDTGGGISERVLPKLLREPIKKEFSETSLGIGLLIALTIVQTYGGTIKILETSPRGTAMVIRLPKHSQNA